jgi:mono/diheme cytochrome c family protein
MPGKPKPESRWRPPTALTGFTTLYRKHCLACHSDSAAPSASIPMNHPVYLNILPPDTLRRVIANGIPGTAMPNFSQETGGPLTDEQIGILADGILAWKTRVLPGPLPAYSAPPGDVARGARAFATFCASCHGADGTGGPRGSVVEPACLGLVTDQYLRTVIIAGRPDLGMPDWRGHAPGKPMSDQDIADVVAWLASHRVTPTPQPSDIDIR